VQNASQSVVDFVNRWAPVRQLPPGTDLSAYRHKSSADDFISRIKISGDDDVFSSPISPLRRGWPWKALKKDENANLNNWMPRLMPNESTPVTEMLASAGKQSVLHGLGGGAVGAGLGYAAGSLTGSPGSGAAVGGGLGALAGGAYGYSQRRKKNDPGIDAGALGHDTNGMGAHRRLGRSCL
jgi:Glycine zipper